MFYVSLPDHQGATERWASGLPEEGIVRNMGKQTPAEPHLEVRVDVRFWLFSNALVNQDGGYDLSDVSGMLFERMKLLDGNKAYLQRDVRFIRMALSSFASRFTDI